jgi:hypothetical protein
VHYPLLHREVGMVIPHPHLDRDLDGRTVPEEVEDIVTTTIMIDVGWTEEIEIGKGVDHPIEDGQVVDRTLILIHRRLGQDQGRGQDTTKRGKEVQLLPLLCQ